VPGCSTCVLWPQFLPDGRHFLYTDNDTDDRRAGIFVGSLDSRFSRKIISTRSSTFFADAGYLLYVDHGALLERRFDPQQLAIAAEPTEIARDVAWNRSTGRGAFAASQSGIVVFRPVARSRLRWYSRTGAVLGEVGPVGEYDSFSVSPDGTRVAAALVDPRVGTPDLWLFDARGSGATRLTFDAGSESDPTWASDGRRLIYSAQVAGGPERVQSVEASSAVSRVIPGLNRAVFLGRTRQGVVVYIPDDSHPGIPGAHWLVRDDKLLPVEWPSELVHTMTGRVSPDDHWLAYGEPDVDSRVMRRALYVRALAAPGGRWQVASEGVDPRWRSDSRELFFLGADGLLRAASLSPQGPTAAPKVVLRVRMSGPSGLLGQAYDISPDGSSILAKVPAETTSLVVVVNAWTK
jgi:dipeptidyl aminopeptidase/acylaminoacyl peptidase